MTSRRMSARPNSATEAERAWLRTFMHIVRITPSLVREPSLVDRQMNEKYKVGIDLDRPRDPTETQRLPVTMFCASMTAQRFTHFMRDDELRTEMRELMHDVPMVREIFEQEEPIFVRLVDTDPPALRLASLDGQTL